MADIFLSYQRADRPAAERIVRALAAAGLTTWFDAALTPLEAWDATIEREIGAARAVIVLWSPRSVASEWVRSEAHYAQERGKLVPVLIAPCAPPIAFLLRQAVDLSGWAGHLADPDWRRLLEWVHALDNANAGTVTAPAHGAGHGAAPAAPARARRFQILVATILLTIVSGLALAFLLHRPVRSSAQRAVTVEAVAAPAGDAGAQLFRQSLSNDLSRLVVGNGATLAIADVNGADKGKPDDLMVKGEAQTSGGLLHATIRLVSGEGTILWSDAFARPSAELEALRQAVAAKTADVLLCALGVESGRTDSAPLDLPTLRLYLSGCELRHDKWRESAALFRQVAEARPDFAPAWANLAGRTALYAGQLSGAEKARGFSEAKDYAERALRLDPSAGAAWFALAHIQTGMGNWIARQQTIDKGLAAGAIYAPLYTDALLNLGEIGRNRDVLDLSRRAAAADPFGSIFAYNLAEALALGGHADDAAALLRQADTYWPNDPKADILRFKIVARAGDAGQAAAMLANPALATEYSPRALADWRLFLAARSARNPAEAARVAAAFRANAAGASDDDLNEEIIDLVQLGRIDDAFALSDLIGDKTTVGRSAWFADFMAPLHADPRFMRLAGRRGIAAIWIKTGLWPDFCVDRNVAYDCRAAARRALAMTR